MKPASATGILAVIATEARRLTKSSKTASQTQMKMRNATLQTKRKTVTTLQRKRTKLVIATGILAVTATEARRPIKLFQTASQTQMKMKKTTTLQIKRKSVVTLQMRNMKLA